MKILMIISCVLAITAVVCGFNTGRYYQFKMNMCRCKNEWDENNNTSEIPDAVLFKCATMKDGNVFKENSYYVKLFMMYFLQDLIYDEKVLSQAKMRFNECYNTYAHILGYFGRYNTTNKISECASSIISMIT